ncbi:hypothetical protein GF367_00830 [Candidatus Woesearchaeota archaeon]|nr:hypothetical protein [Candidatus Woesearchaeota archaeon]
MTDEYELLPAEELARLRREVEALKANPIGDSEHGKNLLEAVSQLNATMNRLIKVFSDAEQEMVKEYDDVKKVDDQLDDLQEQNRKIATGILTVADMFKKPGAQRSAEREGAATPDPPPFTPKDLQQSSAFSTLPSQPRSAPPEQRSASPAASPPHPSFAEAYQSVQSRPPPVDPWQPQSASPEQQPPGQQEEAPGPAPGQQTEQQPSSPPAEQSQRPQQSPPSLEVPPAEQAPDEQQSTMPPPPPPPNKKGVFGLFK